MLSKRVGMLYDVQLVLRAWLYDQNVREMRSTDRKQLDGAQADPRKKLPEELSCLTQHVEKRDSYHRACAQTTIGDNSRKNMLC